MVSFVSTLLLVAQMCLVTLAEYESGSGSEKHRDGESGKQWHHHRDDACMQAAGHNETMCNMLSANCSWSPEKAMCHKIRSNRNDSDSDSDRQRGDGWEGSLHGKPDECSRAAGRNESACTMLSLNCTWSVKREMCYSREAGRGSDHKSGDGVWEGLRERHGACATTAGRNETMCKSLSSNCSWSSEFGVCYSNRNWLLGATERGHEKDGVCMDAAGRNKTMCHALSPNCTWSEKRRLCHSAHEEHDANHWKGMAGGKGDRCSKAAGSNETICVSLAHNCTWIASRSICLSVHFKHDKDDKDSLNGSDYYEGEDREHDKDSLNEVDHYEGEDREHDKDSLNEGDHYEGEDREHRDEKVGNTIYHEPAPADKKTESEAIDTILLTLRLNNIQFSLLEASPSVLSELTLKVKRVIADSAGEGVLPNNVTLEIMPGSVIISAAVRTFSAERSSAVTVQSNLNDAQVLADITAEVKAIAGIESVATGDVSTSIVSAPAVRTSSPSTSRAESESKLPFIVGSVAGGVAMLSIMSFGCFLYRHLGRKAGKDAQTEKYVIGREIQLDV